MLDVPVGDADPVSFVLFAVLAAVALGLLVFFVGPYALILLLFVLELIVWFVVAGAGAVAWLVLRRPWRVDVVDHEGSVVASVPVRGRTRSRRHADLVRSRLAAGMDPSTAAELDTVAHLST